VLPVPTVFANALNDARMITERPERFVLDEQVLQATAYRMVQKGQPRALASRRARSE
jgi:hypothetical protein